MHVRERERGKKKEEEKAQKKPLRHDRDSNPQTMSPEPSVLSIRPWRPAPSIENFIHGYSIDYYRSHKITPSTSLLVVIIASA